MRMIGSKRKFSILGILSIAILFTFSATTSAYAVPTLCTENGNYFDAIIIPQPQEQSWTNANALALASTFTIAGVPVNGHLATITSAEENDCITTAHPGFRGYIGLTDTAVEGTYAWVNGEPSVTATQTTNPYTNWEPGEPNDDGGIGDYAEILNNGLWNEIRNGI